MRLIVESADFFYFSSHLFYEYSLELNFGGYSKECPQSKVLQKIDKFLIWNFASFRLSGIYTNIDMDKTWLCVTIYIWIVIPSLGSSKVQAEN